MTETYPNPEQDAVAGATVLAFPNRAADTVGDDLDVPGWLNQPQPDNATAATVDKSAASKAALPVQAIRNARTTYRQAKTVLRWLLAHRATKFGARQAAFILAGVRIGLRRAWESRTTTTHQAQIRAAAAAGDHESALEWEARASKFRTERHARRMELLRLPLHIAAGIAHGIIAAVLVLSVIGIAMWWKTDHIGAVTTPFTATFNVLCAIGAFVKATWRPTLEALPVLATAAAWAAGRNARDLPAWLSAAEIGDGSTPQVVPDEGAILEALRNLNLGPMNKAFKAGWRPQWVSPTTRSGNGYHTQLRLPQGVTVEMIGTGKTKKVLAHNLLRAPIEVWPTEIAGKEGILDLWVADSGSLTAKVPPYPLIEDAGATVDYFDKRGVPVAISQRGEIVRAPLMAKNYMVGGIMGTGKSSFTRNLLCGAMQDPLVDIGVYVMAFNADYDLMQPRLSVLVKGDEDEQALAALNELRWLKDEVTRRGKLLEKYGETAVTRKLAMRDKRLRPLVRVFDECHELFEHKKHGEEAADLAIKVLKKARKCAMTLVFVTVSPTANSIPKDVTRNTSNRVAFAVGDHVANDGLLGTGKHKAGITATTLNPATDIGTALTIGFSPNAFELVRMFFISADDGNDQVTPLVTRAMKGLDKAGLAPGDTAEQVDGDQARDLLDDVAAAMGTEALVKSSVVISRLADAHPSEYEGWSQQRLGEELKQHGVIPRKTKDGTMHVDRRQVDAALADRAETTGEAAEDDSEDGEI
ncbi:S-DNA-T family DNA segregation ATPase FtsK/SpoIIIE [Catenulispora sp. GP43]|uniref:cell division protein FtsK n=1 Tax=Catenulispora sp. GP43 TaxID=3156263 RepID=UPI0035150257